MTQPDIVAQMTRQAIVAARNALRLMRFAVTQSVVAGDSLSKLDAGTVINNQSGYIGATDVYAGEVQAMLAAFSQLDDAWNTPEVRALHAKFVGAANLEGQ